MANEKKEKGAAKIKKWVVTVKGNPNFVGKGAGGVQFANGKAEITSERLANWFREHKGYEVTEAKEEAE